MSYLSDYDRRTSWKAEPVRGVFAAAEGLRAKVDGRGRFVLFPGTTVAFRAGEECRRTVDRLQDILYQRIDDMLALRLGAATCHMTLHDLVSPEMHLSDTPEGYMAELDKSLKQAAAAVGEIREKYAGRCITLTADRIVNMVSKSLVLLLRPRSEEDFELLMEMYGAFDPILTLPYPLTPHITLAYFRPGMLDGGRMWEAMKAAQAEADRAPAIVFRPGDLTAQFFTDMQSFRDHGEGEGCR